MGEQQKKPDDGPGHHLRQVFAGIYGTGCQSSTKFNDEPHKAPVITIEVAKQTTPQS